MRIQETKMAILLLLFLLLTRQSSAQSVVPQIQLDYQDVPIGKKAINYMLMDFKVTKLDQESDRQDAKTRKFFKKLEKIEAKRMELSEKYKRTKSVKEKRRIKENSRKYIIKSMIKDIIPFWYGTPWYMGPDDDAEYPHQLGKRISCSNFITAVLQNVGFVFDSRKKWADARALYIQTSLADKEQVQRYYGITSRHFAKELMKLTPGLYLVGLNCHIGFILIKNNKAVFIHSNYVNPEVGVTAEAVEISQAIINSEGTGYWITPLLNDDRLIENWLMKKPLILKKMDLRYLYL